MNAVRLCSAAECDFTEALCWYANRDKDVARQFDSALSSIAESPTAFPSFDERHRYMQMRRFPFVIVFREIHESIVVIAVAHTARSSGFWHDR